MKIAVITGASSGMGREFVYALDEKGYDELWLIARREERLKELQMECKTPVRVMALDLMERDSFNVYKDALAETNPEIQVLVNAAGFGLFGTFMEMDLDQQLDIIEKDAIVHTIPYGTITMKQNGASELADMEAMAPYVCGFTDDGKGVQAAVNQFKACGMQDVECILYADDRHEILNETDRETVYEDLYEWIKSRI